MEKIILIIIATVNPTEKEALNHYLTEMNILYAKVEAKPVSKYKISKTLIGELEPNLVSIMEFPSKQAVDAVFKSEEYQKLLPFREKAFLKVEAFLSEE